MDKIELVEKLKSEIIEVLNLEDITPADIDAAAPLFGDGLGLDSIDALEISVLLEKKYDLKFSTPQQAREVFVSVQGIADYIIANR